MDYVISDLAYRVAIGRSWGGYWRGAALPSLYTFVTLCGIWYHLTGVMTPVSYRKDDLLYFAGILDGEGSISLLGEYGRSLTLIAAVGSTSRVLIDWMLDTFGGTVSLDKPGPMSRRPFWRWQVRGNPAAVLLQATQPFMKIKAELAHVGCEGWANRRPVAGHAPLTAETLAIRRRYYLEMRRLNGRAPQDAPRMPETVSRWEPVPVTCAVCGKSFQRKKSSIKRSGRVVCQQEECLKQWKRQSVARALAARWGHSPE